MLAQTQEADRRYKGQFIDGEWCAGTSRGRLPDLNPYDGAVLTELSLASLDDLDRAYRVARAAQVGWAKTLPRERAAMFHRAAAIVERRRDEIIGWIVRETGSTILKAQIEVGALQAGMVEAATMPSRVEGRIMPIDVPDKQSYVFRLPIGVVGVISPWNFPTHLSNRAVAPALAVGNAVVVKPSEESPICGGLLLASIYEEAGLPPGLLNVVVGDVAEIGDAFTLHDVPGLISFTGSTRVGRHIAGLAVSGKRLKHIGLELGGNAPFVVLDDADIDGAVRAAIFARYLHGGQICMSANRIIVDDRIADRFIERFVAHAATLVHGDPADPATNIGPLINARQLAAAERNLGIARDAGFAELLSGETRGLVMAPHVFAGVANDHAFAQTEQFAPIAAIIRADGEDHALELANATDFGLASCVFTGDTARGLRFARRMEAGMSHVNDIPINDSPFNMFGGEKNSGIGRFNGDWIMDELTREHWVTVQDQPRHYPFCGTTMVSMATREIAKGIVPNALFSALAAWLPFGGERYVAVPTIAIDAAPQSGVIATVTVVIVAAAVARSRSQRVDWLRRILPLAAAVGVVVAVAGAGISLSLLPALAPTHWTIGGLLAFKAIYGMVVGAMVTIPALWAARRRLHG